MSYYHRGRLHVVSYYLNFHLSSQVLTLRGPSMLQVAVLQIAGRHLRSSLLRQDADRLPRYLGGVQQVVMMDLMETVDLHLPMPLVVGRRVYFSQYADISFM